MTIETQPTGNTKSLSSDLVSKPKSDPVASTSTKPLSRANRVAGNHQPTPAELKKLGIKVRDFAKEKTLPPIPTIYRHPRQIQPSFARPLQRQLTEPDESVLESTQTNKKVERTPTEPAMTPTHPMRTRAFSNLEALDTYEPVVPEPLHTLDWIPMAAPESQESELDASPLITPNSSFICVVQNTSDIPASQLDRESQFAVPELFSCSQPGFSQETETSNLQENSTFARSSPLTSASLSPPFPAPNQLSAIDIASPQDPTSIKRRTSSIQDLCVPGTHGVLSTRYHLRKRPIPPISHSSPKPPTKRARKVVPTEFSARLMRPSPAFARSSQNNSKDNSMLRSRNTQGRAITDGTRKGR